MHFSTSCTDTEASRVIPKQEKEVILKKRVQKRLFPPKMFLTLCIVILKNTLLYNFKQYIYLKNLKLYLLEKCRDKMWHNCSNLRCCDWIWCLWGKHWVWDAHTLNGMHLGMNECLCVTCICVCCPDLEKSVQPKCNLSLCPQVARFQMHHDSCQNKAVTKTEWILQTKFD